MDSAHRFRYTEEEGAGMSGEMLLRQLATAKERLSALEARLESASPVGHYEGLTARVLLQATLLDNLQDCILILDQQGCIRHMAGNSLGLLGYMSAELLCDDRDLHLTQLVEPEDREMVLRAFDDVCRRPRRTTQEGRIIDKAGERRWIEFAFVPLYGESDEGLTGFQAILRDISSRVQAESMVSSLNEAAQTVQKASLSLDDVISAVTGQLKALGFHNAIGLLDEAQGCIDWVMFGADERRLEGIRRLESKLEHLSRIEIPVFARALRTGRPVQQDMDESALETLLGDPGLARETVQLLGPLSMVVAPLRADGHSLGFLVVASQRPRPESVPAIEAFANQTAIAMRNAQLVDQIAERETQYRAIFEAARDGLIVVDEQIRITAASVAACELFGFAVQEMLGMPLDALVDASREKLVAWSVTAQQGSCESTMQATATGRNNKQFPIEMRSSCLGHSADSHLLVLITDISERMRAQQALIQSERLSALGQMAGGIAHDFNNILVSILGHAQMAADERRADRERLAEHLAQIEAGARDAADAVSRLQSLYRETDDKSDFIPVQLDEILLDALALNRPRWRDIPQMQGITFHVKTQLGRPAPVYGNPSELRRVLNNLIINAIDAMPQGGILAFETGEAGPHSYVRVQDTGVGMSEEEQALMFEPFYTTKKSSGLGLTISQNIVERHEGEIAVQSSPGAGTTFTVCLARCAEQASPQEPWGAPKAAASAEPAVLSILIVDDEPGVRDVLGRMLERLGHQVRAVDSGRAGIAMLQQESFDLLICDFGMPEIQGPEVMQRAHELHPEMPIVLTTGWGDSITPEQLQKMQAVALLPKPFGQQEIQRILEQVLAASETGDLGSRC
jgi:PAS domain S-box-containing protein